MMHLQKKKITANGVVFVRKAAIRLRVSHMAAVLVPCRPITLTENGDSRFPQLYLYVAMKLVLNAVSRKFP